MRKKSKLSSTLASLLILFVGVLIIVWIVSMLF